MTETGYTVTIGQFSTPMTEDQIKIAKMIVEFEGLKFVNTSKDGTLLMFDTLNQANNGT